MATTTEHSYETLKAFLHKRSAEKYLNSIVDEFNDGCAHEDKRYFKEDSEKELVYKRITYSGSTIEDDIDYKLLYIEELEVEES